MAATFDSVADELYAGPREGFIATRAERAAEAKAAGDAELAARIKALRKPSTAAWLVNRLAREHADELARLADLGEELREAHADLDGDRLRELSTWRRAAIDGLAERARGLGADAGGPPGDAIIDQVSGTLEAATADAGAAARVAAGRLDAAIAPSVFEAWLVAPVGTGPRRDAAKATLGASDAPKVALAPSSPRERARQEKLAAAREREQAAQAAREEAEQHLATVTDAAEVAAATAAALQAKLAAAEREARKRREAASTARRAHDAAVRAAAQASREVQRLEPG